MTSSNSKLAVLSAGGSGGHLFPAEALAVELVKRGYVVELASDERAANFAKEFPARTIHALPAATPMRHSVFGKVRALFTVVRGVWSGYRLMKRLKPVVVVGFGGYPTVPPLLGAQLGQMPTVIHEQNGVTGRANRLLCRLATGIATGFPNVMAYEPALNAKSKWTGNPVREGVLEACSIDYDPPAGDGDFRLLVFGGSQGARVMADVVPSAVELLDESLRKRLRIVQQTRAEDKKRVEAAYTRAGVQVELAPFFPDLPKKMADAHLIVSRSGASTVAELSVIGRPSILVPLPDALDQDQAANAQSLVDAGGAIAMPQVSFTPVWLAREITRLISTPETLTLMASLAKRVGIPDASVRLADFVEEIISSRSKS